MRIISWNISTKSNPEKLVDFLKSQIPDNSIVCLQEVLPRTYEYLINELNPESHSYSLDFRQKGKYETMAREMGVLSMGYGYTIKHSDTILKSIFPERTLYTEFSQNGKSHTVLNFHSLTGVGYKKSKFLNFAVIAEFLEYNKPDFFCCDANEPKIDSLNNEEIEFWDNGDKGKFASLIFGKNKVHNLEDSYKLYLKSNNQVNLDLSHLTRGIPRRYDHIYCSEMWKPKSVKYLYDESIEACSDHAMVVGEFSFI